MRRVGDILIISMGNEYRGKHCRITGIHNISGDTRYDIEVLGKEFNWRTGKEDLTVRFSEVHPCHIKDMVSN